MSLAKNFIRFAGLNRYTEWEGKVPTTLFSDRPIKPTDEYCRLVDRERALILFLLAIIVLAGPLIFRYLMGSHTAENDDDGTQSRWGAEMDPWEWSIGMVLFFGFIGTVFRLLPFVCGRPSSFESSRYCVLDGTVGLGMCSPFASEDDTVLLRSLLGRTCTVLSTVGSRHAIHGLYLDVIMNERRIKGEAQRKAIWIAWMNFLSTLVSVSLKMKEEDTRKAELPRNENDLKPESSGPPTPFHRPIFPSALSRRAGNLKPDKFSSTLPTIKSRGDVLGTEYDDDDEDEDNDDPDLDETEEDDGYYKGLQSDFEDAPIELLPTNGKDGLLSRSRSKSSSSSGIEAAFRSQEVDNTKNDRIKVLHLGSDKQIVSLNPSRRDGKIHGNGAEASMNFRDTIKKLSESYDYIDESEQSNDIQTRNKNKNLLNSVIRAFSTSRDEAYEGSAVGRYLAHVKSKKQGLESPTLSSIAAGEQTTDTINFPEVTSTNGRNKIDESIRPAALSIQKPSDCDSRMSFFLHDPQESASIKSVFTPSAASSRKLTFNPDVVGETLISRFRTSSDNSVIDSPPITSTSSRGRTMSRLASVSDDSGYVSDVAGMEYFAIGNPESFPEGTGLANEAPGGDDHSDLVQNRGLSSMIADSLDEYLDGESEVLQRWDNSYASSHGLPSLKIDLADVVPMVQFLEGWLQEMKSNEWTWNYHDPKLDEFTTWL